VSSLLVFVLSPYLLYWRWFTWLREGGPREAIVYPYVQAGEDLVNSLGFAEGAWREHGRRRKVRHWSLLSSKE
jgi:hypothetical protein